MAQGTERRDAVDAWEALYRAQVAVQRYLNQRFPVDIAQSEYDVLYNLYSTAGRSARIRDLHRHLLLTQPSVSRLVDRMAARGLVEKSADEEDARGTVVTMTREGEQLFRRAGAELAAVIAERMLSSLDRGELCRLRELSDALRGSEAPARAAEGSTGASA